MDTPITFTLYGILITVLILTGLTALILTIILIFKVLKVVGKIDKFVDKNSEPLTASIKNLPEITDNVLVVSSNMAVVSKSAGEILNGVDGFIESTSIQDGGIFGTISSVASLVRSVIQVIKSIFGSNDD